MSFFKSSKVKTNEDRWKAKRSNSVSRVSRAKEESSYPEIESEPGDEVATRICTEIGAAILRNPDVNTGVLRRTADASRNSHNKKNTVIVVTAAVMAHIGNTRMSRRVLDRSSQCLAHYKEMGLEDAKLRSVFVTMMFALNPGFLRMLETSLITSMERQTAMGENIVSNRSVVEGLRSLYNSKALTGKEIESIASKSSSSDSEFTDYPVIMGKPEMLTPNDSITRVGNADRVRPKIDEGQIRDYLSRSKSGGKEDFYDVFPSAARPVNIPKRPARTGLGFRDDNPRKVAEGENGIPDINNLMYGLSVPSTNLKDGTIRRREPRVDDIPSASNMSHTAARSPTEVQDTDWSYVREAPKRRPSPTEFTLPTSFGGDEESHVTTDTIKPNSREDLNQFLEELGLLDKD